MAIKVKVMAYKSYIRLLSTMHINSKAMPTNNTDYSCHIKAVELA